MLSKLDVYCSNRCNGCQWKGKSADLKSHRDHCDHELVQCTHEGCLEAPIIRRNLAYHVANCPFKSCECQYCRKLVPGCKLKEHEHDCPKRPIKCPQHCAAQVTVETLAHHLKQACPYTVVQCPFVSHGCDVDKVQRLELEVHLRDAMATHLELLCKKVEQQSVVITQQQTLIKKLFQRTHIVVDANGKGAFTKISDAVQAAEDNDVIFVNQGVFRESLVINKPLTLQAAADNQVLIENGSDSNVIVIRSTCKLIGLHLHQRSKNFFCVRIIVNDDETIIEKCDVKSDHFSCIQIDSGCNPLIRNNKIHDSKQCGILIKKNGKGRIDNNDIHSNSLSNIYVDANANPLVTNNKIHNSAQHGIWIKQFGVGLFENNTIYNNTCPTSKSKKERCQ
eukprot:TRINITY_DN67655_c10_g2_i2.p1 TRINITY_DN67655_c10_g2~~TRINITY_DN67655_c10_g2_i2.p1  ORF type:complete len:393 (+),score=23.75 TRINITY_DN67655_c10_g2_i2:264-1442(+)